MQMWVQYRSAAILLLTKLIQPHTLLINCKLPRKVLCSTDISNTDVQGTEFGSSKNRLKTFELFHPSPCQNHTRKGRNEQRKRVETVVFRCLKAGHRKLCWGTDLFCVLQGTKGQTRQKNFSWIQERPCQMIRVPDQKWLIPLGKRSTTLQKAGYPWSFPPAQDATLEDSSLPPSPKWNLWRQGHVPDNNTSPSLGQWNHYIRKQAC